MYNLMYKIYVLNCIFCNACFILFACRIACIIACLIACITTMCMSLAYFVMRVSLFYMCNFVYNGLYVLCIFLMFVCMLFACLTVCIKKHTSFYISR